MTDDQVDNHGAGLFTLDFTDQEIHGCCCGKVSVSPRVSHDRWSRPFSAGSRKIGHHEQREEGWGKEEKKITFRQVTGTKGNRN
jgi:hypothetical protein